MKGVLDMNNKLETITNLFENNKIRSIWDSEKEEYYFSVVDVISVLTDSNNPRHYWVVLKSRLKEEGIDSEIYHVGNDAISSCKACGACTKLGKCSIFSSLKVAIQNIYRASCQLSTNIF